MRCLTAEEVIEFLGPARFSVNDENRWYRRELLASAELAARQFRVAASSPKSDHALPQFIEGISQWLPAVRPRLLWVSHWEGVVSYDSEAFIRAARRGMGETRSLNEAPGHLFEELFHDDGDEISSAAREELGLFVGLLSQLMMTQSDGWLLADGCEDRLEFWEGNVLFHSDTPAKLEQARLLFREFDCREWE